MPEHIESRSSVFHVQPHQGEQYLHVMDRETGRMMEFLVQSGSPVRIGVRHDPKFLVSRATESIYNVQGDATKKYDSSTGAQVSPVHR